MPSTDPPRAFAPGPRTARIVAGALAAFGLTAPCPAATATATATAIIESAAARITDSAAPLARLRVVTLNAEHQMSRERWRAWHAWCAPRGWTDGGTGTATPAGSQTGDRRPDGIAYCNAVDGTNGRGSRLFAPLRDEAGWRDKTAQLAAALRDATADIVLLQEIGDPAAVEAVVGPDHGIAVSAMTGSHQQVAIAWPSVLTPRLIGSPQTVASLAVTGPDGRRTRPGLAVRIQLAPDRRLAIINLHLKAGCRQGRLTETPSRRPERRFRRAADCGVFQQQVAALEAWVDAEIAQGHAVLVAGDFNRDLRRERRAAMPARSDASDPAAAADPRRIASLLAELDDGAPSGLVLPPTGPYRRLADCHRHIDGFLLDARLARWLAPDRPPKTIVQPWPAPLSLDRVRPTDHCPHRLDLHFTGGLPVSSGLTTSHR